MTCLMPRSVSVCSVTKAYRYSLRIWQSQLSIVALVTQCHRGEQKLGYKGEALDVGIEMKDSRRNTIEFTLASARTQATQKRAARPNSNRVRELREQAERRKTTTESWPC